MSSTLLQNITTLVELEDEDKLFSYVSKQNWKTLDPVELNEALQLIALYGFSGRTERYHASIEHIVNVDPVISPHNVAYLCLRSRYERTFVVPPGVVHERDKKLRTALHCAAERGNVELVQLLFSLNADVNALDSKQEDAITKAMHAGPWKLHPALDVVDGLIAHGAVLDYWRLASLGKTDAVLAELENEPSLLNKQNLAGQTALFIAVRNNHLATVKGLLERSAEPNAICDDGQTALSTACLHSLSQECNPKIIQQLLKHGAKRTLESSIILEDIEAIRDFIHRDLTRLNVEGNESPLNYAIHCWRKASLIELLRLGAQLKEAQMKHIHRLAAGDREFLASVERLIESHGA